jgi:hypothetical protein
MENQRAGFQRLFEFLMTEGNCLAVVVRTYDFEIHAVAHEPPAACELFDLSRCQPGALPGRSSLLAGNADIQLFYVDLEHAV